MQLGSPRACGGRFQQTRTFTSLLHRRQKPFTSICHPPRSNGPVPAIAPKDGGVECRGSVQPRQPGQLGIVASSARFKRDIQAMGEASQSLLQLGPVTFRYKQDPQATRQYGLIAEEVAKVYPELVTRGPDGLRCSTTSSFRCCSTSCNGSSGSSRSLRPA